MEDKKFVIDEIIFCEKNTELYNAFRDAICNHSFERNVDIFHRYKDLFTREKYICFEDNGSYYAIDYFVDYGVSLIKLKEQ